MKNKWEQIGSCGVDSGSIIISDPCYVMPEVENMDELKKWLEDHNDYSHIFSKQLHKDDPTWSKSQVGEVIFAKPGGNGVLCHTTGGDGNFPVYAKRNEDGAITELKIVFVEGGDTDE